MVALRLFGPPSIVCATGGEPLPPERLGQMAVALAARGDWMPRPQLVALLWPELADEAARRNLRKLLFRARRQPWLDGLEVRHDAVRWSVASDLRDFESACAARNWDATVGLYRADFADGYEQGASEPFVEWLRFERSRLAAQLRSAAAQQLAHLSNDGPARERLARHWLQLDPLDEDALAALVESLCAQGRAGEARRVVEEFTQRLVREVGVAPSARVRTLAGSPAAVPARSVVGAGADFVGRRAELLEVQTLLARDDCRALTITGPGGIGKSRLARAALALAAPRFDSTLWIGLEDLAEVAQVAPRLANTLGMTLAGTADPLVEVGAALQGQRALLVFDNAEHLAGIALLAEQLLRACVQLKLVLTSRARLAIAGEWRLPIAGLPVPDADEAEADAVRAFDAVKLFESRARAAAPTFDAVRSAAEVAALVRSLEGAPLAIELAAAWVRLLPVAEIRREIERSIDLLEGAMHAPDRHRSVRASFEQSWRLLVPVEQRGLAQLSVFAGPFTREAAAQVAGTPLPVLAALADKSLLRADGDGRFSFHALMRECARAKLIDVEASQARHADYFVRTLASARTAWPDQQAERQLIEDQLEDYRLAWRRAVSRRETLALETMALPLMRFFVVKGRFAEGIEMIGEALRSLPSPSSMATAVLLHALGTLQYRHGDLAVAGETLQRSLALYRRFRAPTALVRPCTVMLSMTAWTRGDPRGAQRHLNKVLRLAQADGDASGSAQAFNGLALCARALGNYDSALELHGQALQLLRRTGNAMLEASVLHDLGSLQYTLLRFGDAKDTLHRALQLCEANGLASVRLFCLLSLAFAEIELRQLESAQGHLEQALQAERAAGESLVSAMVYLALARIETRRGDLALAGPWLRQGLERARALASVPTQAVALGFAAEWLAAGGARERAAALWSCVADHPQAEAGEHEDARRALRQLQLTKAEAKAAVRAARAFDLVALVDALITELGG